MRSKVWKRIWEWVLDREEKLGEVCVWVYICGFFCWFRLYGCVIMRVKSMSGLEVCETVSQYQTVCVRLCVSSLEACKEKPGKREEIRGAQERKNNEWRQTRGTDWLTEGQTDQLDQGYKGEGTKKKEGPGSQTDGQDGRCADGHTHADGEADIRHRGEWWRG